MEPCYRGFWSIIWVLTHSPTHSLTHSLTHSYSYSGVYIELDVHDIEGDGIVTTECDFFNAAISMWEPILETYSINLELKKEKKALNFDVLSGNTLQINVSGKMLDVLITAYQDYVKRVEEISLRIVKSLTKVLTYSLTHSLTHSLTQGACG